MGSMHRWISASAAIFSLFGPASAQNGPLTGDAAFGDWRSDRPGVVRLDTPPADLPKPGNRLGLEQSLRVVPRPRSSA